MTGVLLNDECLQVDLLSILAEIADLDDGRSVARFLGCHFSIQIQQVIIHRLSHVDTIFRVSIPIWWHDLCVFTQLNHSKSD